MTPARFVLVAGHSLGGLRASWPSVPGLVGRTTPDGTWFAWRLLGGNNRELGRSAGVQPSRALCIDAIAQVREQIADADLGFVCDTGSLSWRWRITHGPRLLAVSGRAYQRHRESQYSARLFRLAVADPMTTLPFADPDPDPADNDDTAVAEPTAAGPHAEDRESGVERAPRVRAVLPTITDLRAADARPAASTVKADASRGGSGSGGQAWPARVNRPHLSVRISTPARTLQGATP